MSRASSRPQVSQSAKPVDLTHLESDISSLYTAYIIDKTSPIRELERNLHALFTTERFISLRGELPRALNAGGNQLLEVSPKLWLLCIAAKLFKTPTMKSIFPLLKAALGTVVNRKEIVEGLDPILQVQDVEITAEDTQMLEKLVILEPVPACPEPVALSECGKYALVRLTPSLQKKLQWTFAVTPVDGNDWIPTDLQVPHKPLSTLFVDSGYSYHPGSIYKS